MRQAVIGLLAHVDAGKTTLAEAMLFEAGAIRACGRVDHGDAHLDTEQVERERGITVFSKQAHLDYAGAHLMLLDAPGHVDFSAEAERTLRALDCAVLVVGANDGVQGHTETLMDLLDRYGVPVVVFVNKMDLDTPGRAELLGVLRARLGSSCVDGAALLAGEAPSVEDAAAADEGALEEFLETDALAEGTIRRLVASRAVFPVFFGSALHGEGVRELLDALALLAPDRAWPAEFAARVYKVSRSPRGERLSWIKVTGGALRAKAAVAVAARGSVWEEKIDQVRIYQGERFETVQEVPAGGVCAVTGLGHTAPGTPLGAEPAGAAPILEPALSYRVLPGEHDVHTAMRALTELADEDPLLKVAWVERLQEIHVQLMGSIQQEVLQRELERRFGLSVSFGQGGVLYRETITRPVEGVGHFEPLRHYAEVELLLEPLPRGAGVRFGTMVGEDDLDRNWQRLALTNAMEREHAGTLTGAPITDVRISLIGGRAHDKHTEGGDFRQATYRAIRQALMVSRSRGECELLEPWYRFRLMVPEDKVGRALSDLTRMAAAFGAPALLGDRVLVAGEAPVSEIREYPLEVAGYTGGRGSLSLEFAGYRSCHDAERVVEEAAYDPLADPSETPDSIFCSHGAGHAVSWDEVPAHAHVEVDRSRLRPWREADASFFRS